MYTSQNGYHHLRKTGLLWPKANTVLPLLERKCSEPQNLLPKSREVLSLQIMTILRMLTTCFTGAVLFRIKNPPQKGTPLLLHKLRKALESPERGRASGWPHSVGQQYFQHSQCRILSRWLTFSELEPKEEFQLYSPSLSSRMSTTPSPLRSRSSKRIS